MADEDVRARPWLASGVVTVCVALEMLVAASGLERATRVATMFGLGSVAVGIALVESLGLRWRSGAVRAIIAVPLVLCVVLTVVLMLEADFRRALVRP